MSAKLNSFGVRGFRALKSLNIEALGSVNLFVGKNNTGKTTVLEALRIYLSSDPRLRIFNLLTVREEFNFPRRIRTSGLSLGDNTAALSFEALFSGRQEIGLNSEFRFGEIGELPDHGLAVKFAWLRREEANEEYGVRYHLVENIEGYQDVIPGYVVTLGEKSLIGPLDRFGRVIARRRLSTESDSDVVYVPSSGMTMREIGETWDTIALTDDEDEVVKALKIIAPDLDKIVLIQSPQEVNQRMLMAKMSTFANPVPFRSLGEGTVHLLSIVLAMIQARNGTVLLDEIENGVHYSVQSSMWKLIIQQSIKLNVQVFATTHSSDCVRGLQEASLGHSVATSKLFRLEKEDDDVKVVEFSTEELEIAQMESIEIR